jgi:hypothetical protein
MKNIRLQELFKQFYKRLYHPQIDPLPITNGHEFEEVVKYLRRTHAYYVINFWGYTIECDHSGWRYRPWYLLNPEAVISVEPEAKK